MQAMPGRMLPKSYRIIELIHRGHSAERAIHIYTASNATRNQTQKVSVECIVIASIPR
jgi:hypothetical protein